MSDPLRLLHVLWNFDQGGLERLVHELARRMDPSAIDTHVLSLGTLGHFAHGLEGVATLHVAGPMHRLSLIAPLALAEQIRRIRPTIVHTHSGVWYKAAKAARWAGVGSIIHTDHGRAPSAGWTDTLVERRAGRMTDRVVAVAPWLVEFNATVLRVPRDKLSMIPNGVDTMHFEVRGTTPRPPYMPSGRRTVGSAGRFAAVKDYATMIRAMGVLRSQWDADEMPILVLIGDGPERPRLEQVARELGVAEFIRFPGWTDRVADFLAHLDIFSLSSTSEGTSMSLLEAMSAGVCPVVTDVGGNADVLGPDLRARLVPPGNPAALASAWTHAFRHAEQARRDAEIAKARARAVYDIGVTTTHYTRLYRDLAQRVTDSR